MTEQGRRTDKPGLPLWLAAERKRAELGIAKSEWPGQIGIGRRSYDRLTTQENKPITRTVKKIAGKIGMDLQEAMALAGYMQEPGERVKKDVPVDVEVRREGDSLVVRLRNLDEIRTGFATLRGFARHYDMTLGDAIVVTGLADPEELATTQESPAEQDDDDLADGVVHLASRRSED